LHIGCKACEVACKEWNQVPNDGFTWSGNSYDNTAILAHRLGGSAREIEIDGGVITHGQGIIPVELDGAIQSRWVSGEFKAA